MIAIPSDSQKCENSKRRMMRRTGLPASAFAPFANTSEPIEVDAISLQREPVPVPVEFPDAAEPEGFRVEIKDSVTGKWLPASGCKARARDHEVYAESLANTTDKQAVRIIKSGGARAFKCWNV